MRTGFLGVALLLVATAAFASPCLQDQNTLCLNSQRFKVSVTWEDFDHHTGVGTAVPLTSDTGYFWFFGSNNVELVIKVLDGRALNQHYWVFYGALSSVAYTITVQDTETGRVKTYNNPSGNFGSVGDTEAFAASSGKSVAESSPLIHTAAATDCPSEATALNLSNCRFRVEVKWKDFSGNTGVGTAVPLTSDTGYFWFFGSSNVELVVKVLDGRPLNGEFWVFYGALSSVEYEMTVTDTVTGNIKTYRNPSGRFASVGDTSAFRSGSNVTATADSSRAISTPISTDGGTLSATSIDGTRFTLTIPPGALLSDEQITMTPVSSIDNLPLSGGLRAAVQLQPEGLRLQQPATLTVATPVTLPSGSVKAVGFSYHRSGEEFHLFPAAINGSTATIQLMHFSGYGVGAGTDSDISNQQQRTPASPEDQAQQNLAAGLERAAVLQSWWTRLVADLIGAGSDATGFDIAFNQFLVWQSLALSEPTLLPLIEQGWSLVNTALINSLQQANLECGRDPSRLLHFAAIALRPDLRSRSGDAVAAATQLIPRCLHFDLKFHSRMTFSSEAVNYDSVVDATVPFHLELAPTGKLIVAPASAPLTYTSFTASTRGCTTATDASGSTFTIVNDESGRLSYIDFPLNFSPDPFYSALEGRPTKIALAINHGDPVDRILSITCAGQTAPVPSGPMWFRAGWSQFHSGFIGGGENEAVVSAMAWQIRNWDFLGGDPWAQKLYTRSDTQSGVTQSENSTLQIQHTPVP